MTLQESAVLPRTTHPLVLATLLLLCGGLTAEEAVHLIRSRPAEPTTRTAAYHPDCRNLNSDGTVVECPSRGYGPLRMVCTATACAAKEPTTGLRISSSEQQMLHPALDTK